MVQTAWNITSLCYNERNFEQPYCKLDKLIKIQITKKNQNPALLWFRFGFICHICNRENNNILWVYMCVSSVLKIFILLDFSIILAVMESICGFFISFCLVIKGGLKTPDIFGKLEQWSSYFHKALSACKSTFIHSWRLGCKRTKENVSASAGGMQMDFLLLFPNSISFSSDIYPVSIDMKIFLACQGRKWSLNRFCITCQTRVALSTLGVASHEP